MAAEAVAAVVAVWLESGWLRLLEASVGVVHVASGLGLVLLDRIGEEVNRVALLISLVEASKLRLVGLLLRHGIVVEQRGSVAALKFPAPSFLFFLAKLDGFRQVVIVVWPVLSALALLPIFLLLVPAGL
ncbi:hypothetical protein HG530_002390 [Fusarium avenaceum]|nr:hypothetical protein HG530_002390 [Fusarium avenaceum]